MSQTTLDEDDLFDEAASEVRADVEEHLRAAREALPEADAVWEVDADNTLGVLNALRSALDAGEAGEHVRDAKKRYLLGERAGAFEDADDLGEEIEELESVIESLETANEEVGELTGTIPELRKSLEEAHDAGDEDEESEDDG